MHDNELTPFAARYTPQKIERFKGNPLIEALPPAMSDEELVELLAKVPDFSPEQRSWSNHERMQQTMQLSNFLIPFQRHMRLARAVDMLLREGYADRIPRSPEFNRVINSIYDNRRNPSFLTNHDSAQMSTSFIGHPGVGKTRTLHAILRGYPPVVYHEKIDIYQIPALIVETPSNGTSTKDLAYAVFRQIDRLVPGATYSIEYSENISISTDALKTALARALHIHCVGFVIFDEIQNLTNTPRNKQSLMTTLVSLSNELGVPVIFVGTMAAQKVLNMAMRQARRSAGFGIEVWRRFRADNPVAQDTEWAEFIETLWNFQWVRNPAALTDRLRQTMYELTQGVPDIVIKLFVLAQWDAIESGSETITESGLDHVANVYLGMLKRYIDALREDDLTALNEMDDIQPLNFDALWAQAAQGRLHRTLGLPSLTPTAKPAIVQEAPPIGDSKPTANAKRGTKQVTRKVEAPQPDASKDSPHYPEGDLRRAFQQARESGRKTVDVLRDMLVVRDIDAIVSLN